jgi:ribonucleoside-diphosphate reductase alpha chain
MTATHPQPMERPGTLAGQTYKIKWADSDHAIYITVNDIVQDGIRRPFEVLVNSRNMEHFAWMVGLTRMISAVFRRGGDVSSVVDELKAVFDPRGGQWHQGRYVPSLLAAIGEVLEEHLLAIACMAPRTALGRAIDNAPRPTAAALSASAHDCPGCGTLAPIRQEECAVCTSCGYSKCG